MSNSSPVFKLTPKSVKHRNDGTHNFLFSSRIPFSGGFICRPTTYKIVKVSIVFL